MKAGELCTRDVVVGYRETPIVEAAGLMREHHVGSLVIVADRAGERVPVGVLTDRDIVVAVIAKGLDPNGLKVGDVVTGELIAVDEDLDIGEALRVMRERGIRRLPVRKRDGTLAGLLTLDDLLELAAEELDTFARIVNVQRVRETMKRRG